MRLTMVTVNIGLLWLFSLLSFFLAVVALRRVAKMGATPQHRSAIPDEGGLPSDVPAPHFSAVDHSGKTHTLKEYVGRPFVLFFVSLACKPCLARLAELDSIGNRGAEDGFGALFVNLGDPESTATLVQAHGLVTQVLSASRQDNRFASDYRIKFTPSYTLVGESGLVEFAGILDDSFQATLAEWNATRRLNSPPLGSSDSQLGNQFKEVK